MADKRHNEDWHENAPSKRLFLQDVKITQRVDYSGPGARHLQSRLVNLKRENARPTQIHIFVRSDPLDESSKVLERSKHILESFHSVKMPRI